jgi:hypothetical protein
MAITITRGAGLTTWTTQLELDLYAGTPESSTTWQGTDYPGAITAFQNNQTDRAQVTGTKLLCGVATITDYKAAAITLQVSGESTLIQTFVLGSPGVSDHVTTGLGSGCVGTLSDTAGNGNNDTLTIVFPGGISDVANAQIQIWLVVA